MFLLAISLNHLNARVLEWLNRDLWRDRHVALTTTPRQCPLNVKLELKFIY